MNPISGLNATFGGVMARPGNVAFISQSGALCTAVLDWSIREQVGFSAFVSIGSMLDVDFGDLIDYVGNDPRTQSIVIYMESIGNARNFLSAAREVAFNKPIIVIKAGRTEAAAKAAASHTGSLTGSFEVLDAAFMRAGVLRVNSISELFNMAEVLGKQPRPKGPRLTILTNAGGPGVLATDALIVSGGELAEVSEKTFKELNDFLPPHWSRNNPIDILGDAGPDRYAKALEIAANDPNSDGLMVILTPQDMTDPTITAEKLKPYAKIEGKPVIASWMGGPVVSAGNDILNRVGIPTFNYPDTAARTFTYMWKYSDNLNHLYELPEHSEMDTGDMGAGREAAAAIINEVRKQGRTTLTEFESKKLLAAYGIPTVPTEIATSPDQAAKMADQMGYPVVLKLHSETITHKTDVGGVKLNLANREAVIAAYNEILKSVTEKAGAQHFHGVAVQKMIKMDGYEITHRQLHRSAIRPGAAVRQRRPTGRGVQGPRAGPAAAQPHPRPPQDGKDENLPRPQRRARTQAGGPRRAGTHHGALQPARGGESVDRRKRHQSAAGLGRTDHRRGRAVPAASVKHPGK
jgi:acetyltransferase